MMTTATRAMWQEQEMVRGLEETRSRTPVAFDLLNQAQYLASMSEHGSEMETALMGLCGQLSVNVHFGREPEPSEAWMIRGLLDTLEGA